MHTYNTVAEQFTESLRGNFVPSIPTTTTLYQYRKLRDHLPLACRCFLFRRLMVLVMLSEIVMNSKLLGINILFAEYSGGKMETI
jgi:hypothetical protein